MDDISAVGAYDGALYILYLNPNGTLRKTSTVLRNASTLVGFLSADVQWAYSVSSIGSYGGKSMQVAVTSWANLDTTGQFVTVQIDLTRGM